MPRGPLLNQAIMNETISTPTPAEEPAPAQKKSIRLTTVLLWAAIIGLLALLGWGLVNVNASRPEAGSQAPDFTVEFFNGYEWEGRPTATLQDMAGKVVVLNFWASWCVECRYETDALEQAWQRYKDDAVFLGVAYADVEPNSLAYMKEFGVTFPHAPDLGTDISQTYEITGVPETFFIGKDGTIAHVQIGPLNEATLDSIIGELLAQ
jgi:cytochrome c biogenesis protein CcmG/thiol:disulfide interchange protein DsbE